MDMCISGVQDTELAASEIIEQMGEAIKKNPDFKGILVLPNARIPIVKLKDSVTNISCDIGYNNMLAIHNTQLLETYSRIDERLKLLAYAVKHWAKRRKINEPYYGSLSRYESEIGKFHPSHDRVVIAT